MWLGSARADENVKKDETPGPTDRSMIDEADNNSECLSLFDTRNCVDIEFPFDCDNLIDFPREDEIESRFDREYKFEKSVLVESWGLSDPKNNADRDIRFEQR
jgi:hypothetical protein